MNKFILIIVVLIFSISCKTGQFSRSEKRQRKEAYVYSFKMTYFKKILLEGFNNSSEIQTILNADHSNYGEIVLSMEDFKFIDSVVLADKTKLIADSSASIGRVAEGADGKRIFDLALARYQSKWLNEIAAKRSRSYTDVDLSTKNNR